MRKNCEISPIVKHNKGHYTPQGCIPWFFLSWFHHRFEVKKPVQMRVSLIDETTVKETMVWGWCYILCFFQHAITPKIFNTETRRLNRSFCTLLIYKHKKSKQDSVRSTNDPLELSYIEYLMHLLTWHWVMNVRWKKLRYSLAGWMTV